LSVGRFLRCEAADLGARPLEEFVDC